MVKILSDEELCRISVEELLHDGGGLDNTDIAKLSNEVMGDMDRFAEVYPGLHQDTLEGLFNLMNNIHVNNTKEVYNLFNAVHEAILRHLGGE